MKTIVIAAGLTLFYTTAVKAQIEAVYNNSEEESNRESRKMESNVNYQTIQHFKYDFPKAENVNWNKSRNFEEATYTDGGRTFTAYYDIESNLVGTVTSKNYADVPASGREYIRKHYKDYTVENVVLFDDNENNETDMTLYNTEFEDADNYFVVLKNDRESIIVKVDMEGAVSYFKKL